MKHSGSFDEFLLLFEICIGLEKTTVFFDITLICLFDSMDAFLLRKEESIP